MSDICSPAINKTNPLLQVRAMLEDYSYHDDYDLRGSSSLTIVEVPLSSRSLQSGGKQPGGSKVDLLAKMPSTPKEEM